MEVNVGAKIPSSDLKGLFRIIQKRRKKKFIDRVSLHCPRKHMLSTKMDPRHKSYMLNDHYALLALTLT